MIILNYITAITIVIAVLITINFIAYMIVDREYLNSSEARNMMKSTMYIESFIFVVYLLSFMIIGTRLI